MKPIFKNTQEKTFPKTLEIPNGVVNSIVGGKSLLWTSTKGFIMHAEMTLRLLLFTIIPFLDPHYSYVNTRLKRLS
jgi:hypothetical protein